MPATPQDRLYGLTTSVAVKPPVFISADYDITCFGEQTITSKTPTDERTITTTEGMRILLLGQDNPVENGIWVARRSFWVRAPDFNGSRDAVNGTLVFSITGDCWQVEANDPVVIGLSVIHFRPTYPFEANLDIFQRTLRVPEASVSVLPSAEDRAWKGLGFDGAGQPKLQDPAGTGLWGYVPAIGSFEKGSIITERFQVLLWEANNEYWRWDGSPFPPKIVLPGSTPDTAGGRGKGKWLDVTDATLRSSLGSNELPGTGIVSLKYSGTVTDALQYIYVNALGKFNNREDGCAEAILERQLLLGAPATSIFVEGKEYYGVVEFPNGTFALEDLQLKSGWLYKLNPFTRIVPHRNAQYAFTTVGTKGVVPGDPTWDRLMYCEISGGVIGDFWKETGDVPRGAGGINLLNGSYVRLRNIAIRHVRGTAIYGGELFDSPFENVSVMYCGNDDPTNYAPCVLFDNAGGHDATNACKFDSLHLEANHTGGLWNKCRHMVFNSLKVERDEGTHVFAGCMGIIVNTSTHTFNRNDIPQFLIKDFPSNAATGEKSSDSRSVKFLGPSLISSTAGKGWYFWHTSDAGKFVLEEVSADGTGLIFKGKRAIITGGTSYDCGPVLVDAEKDVVVELVSWRAIRKTVAGDGTDDAIIFRGANCKAVGNDFTGQPVDSVSLAIPNGAFINSVASADSVITDNTVGGYRQYGIRAAVNQKLRDNKINLDNNHIGSLTNQSRSNSTLVIDNTTGFGLGTVNQSAPVLAAGATQELTIVGGCTDLLIRVISGTTAAAAKVLADSSIAGLGVYSQLNPSLLSFSAGTPGDGMVHITKPLSGYSITVANYTAGNATVVITRISAMTTQ